MPFIYATRLRRDLQEWQTLGLIAPDQAERIAAHAFAPRGLKGLQTVLGFCIVLLLAPAIIAFVAANWSAMSAASRMAVLFLADAAVVGGTFLVAARDTRDGLPMPSKLVDGLATLSVVFAAATLALVAQTFHTPSDPKGYSITVALIGLVTAAVTRSVTAGVIASLALITADFGTGGLMGSASLPETTTTVWFWIIALPLFFASFLGWLPRQELILILVLSALANHLEVPPPGFPISLSPDRTLTVAALALALGHALTRLDAEGRWVQRIRDGGQALTRAAVGLFLMGFVLACAQTIGFLGSKPTFGTALAVIAIAFAAFVIDRLRASETAKPPLSDLMMLGAAALSLAVWIALGSARTISPLTTVCGGIVPALALIIAGDLDQRRALYGWGITLTAALTLGMLVMSKNLIAFSGLLVVCAVLLTGALIGCRWASRRIAGRIA